MNDFAQWFKIAQPILTEAWDNLIAETPEVLEDMDFAEFCQEVFVEA
jgi:hypothetical protein